MNREKLSQMQWKRVRVRPIARRVDRFGVELEQIDDSWPITAIKPDRLGLGWRKLKLMSFLRRTISKQNDSTLPRANPP